MPRPISTARSLAVGRRQSKMIEGGGEVVSQDDIDALIDG
jgi:hypothetical protein